MGEIFALAGVFITTTCSKNARLPSREHEAIVYVALESAGRVAVDDLHRFGISDGDMLGGDADECACASGE